MPSIHRPASVAVCIVPGPIQVPDKQARHPLHGITGGAELSHFDLDSLGLTEQATAAAVCQAVAGKLESFGSKYLLRTVVINYESGSGAKKTILAPSDSLDEPLMRMRSGGEDEDDRRDDHVSHIFIGVYDPTLDAPQKVIDAREKEMFARASKKELDSIQSYVATGKPRSQR